VRFDAFLFYLFKALFRDGDVVYAGRELREAEASLGVGRGAAPLVSVTTPIIVPEVVCATAAGTNASKEIINAANMRFRKLRMGNPPPKINSFDVNP